MVRGSLQGTDVDLCAFWTLHFILLSLRFLLRSVGLSDRHGGERAWKVQMVLTCDLIKPST